jgi:6,7-dimethyl-8-ribityllumazine synthase
MAAKKINLSDIQGSDVPSGAEQRVGIIVAEWNSEITFRLRDGAIDTLTKHGVAYEDIIVKYVPGAFELTKATEWMMRKYLVDSIIVIGCIVRGGTPHFEYICSAVSNGITNLNTQEFGCAVFGVLTVDTFEQGMERAGGAHGNKGVEAAVTALKMMALQDEMDEEDEIDSFLSEMDADDFDDEDDDLDGDDTDDNVRKL